MGILRKKLSAIECGRCKCDLPLYEHEAGNYREILLPERCRYCGAETGLGDIKIILSRDGKFKNVVGRSIWQALEDE